MNHSGEFDPEDPLLRRLMDAGRDEAPTSEAFGRTVAALGIAATALTASASASAAASVTAGAGASAGTGGIVKTAALGWGGLAKWLGIGFGAGLATFGAVEGVRQVTATETSKPGVAVATPAPRAVKTTRVQGAHAETPLIEPAAEPVEEELAAPAPRNANDPLGRELARLDAARAALHGGRPSQALVELERYTREHPRGRLLPEALVLKMQALERTGDREGARATARRLLETAPASPHAGRARALLGAPH